MIMLIIIKVIFNFDKIIGLLLEKLGKKKLAVQNYKAAIKKCTKD